MIQPEWLERDYYQDLGLSASASQEEIKKKYRSLARELHPDSHPGDKVAEEKFKKVSEAYAVIGDAAKRKEYDEARKMLKSGAFQGGHTSSGNSGFASGFNYGGGSFNLSDVLGGFSNQTGGINEMLGNLFGGGGAGGFTPSNKGRDIQTDYKIGFKEAVLGTTVTLLLSNSAGNTAAKKITVRIPAGVETGSKIRIAGKGESGVNGGPAGDLYVKVQVTNDRLFSRAGKDIKITVPVSFPELVFGATLTVPTLTSKVNIKIPPHTQNGKVFRIKGKGVVKANQSAGDLLVKVEVKVPENLSAAAKENLTRYEKDEAGMGFNPRLGWPGS